MARPQPAESDPLAKRDPAAYQGEPGLFGASGSFELFPGAVLLVDREGRPLGATRAAQPLADHLIDGNLPELMEAVATACQGKAAQITPLLLDAPGQTDEVGQAYDLVALPWSRGAAVLVVARDITLERSLRAALIESRQRYKDLVEAASDFAWETDSAGCFIFVSPRGALGYAAGQLVGQPAGAMLLEDGGAADSPFLTHQPLDRVEIWVRSAAEESVCLSTIALPLVGADGEWRGARGVCRDITPERTRDAELARARHREALLSYILRTVRDELEPERMLAAAAGALVPALSARGAAIYHRRGEGRMTRAATAGRLPAAKLVQPLLGRVLAGEDDLVAQADDGQLLVRATSAQNLSNGALVIWRDEATGAHDDENRPLLVEVAAQIGVVNERLTRERALEEKSSLDGLTGLLNRVGFLERMAKRFDGTGKRAPPGALFYLDLDNFKAVNDSFGHEAGDRLLVGVANLLRQHIRRGDLAARLGGDEFVLYLAGMDAAGARRKGQSLLDAAQTLREDSAKSGQPFGLSIGVALDDPVRPRSIEELLARADEAMYRGKRAGKSRVVLAKPADGEGER